MGYTGVYCYQLSDKVHIGPSANLRQYYHKLKRIYGTDSGYRFIGYIETPTKQDAVELIGKLDHLLAPLRTADHIYRIRTKDFRTLMKSHGHPITFRIRGT